MSTLGVPTRLYLCALCLFCTYFIGHDEDSCQTSSSSSASLVNAPFARPSTQQIWERIYKRMLELHPELATSKSAFKTSLQDTQLVGHFDLLSEQKEIEHTAAVSSRKEQFVIFSQDNDNLKRQFQMLRRENPFSTLGTAKHSEEDLRSAVESQNAQESRMVTHNPSCSVIPRACKNSKNSKYHISTICPSCPREGNSMRLY